MLTASGQLLDNMNCLLVLQDFYKVDAVRMIDNLPQREVQHEFDSDSPQKKTRTDKYLHDSNLIFD